METPPRIVQLDRLRGLAVLGILCMNIQSFAMPDFAYGDPSTYGDLSGANRWTQHLVDVLAHGKFISIFAMLFGAGIVLRDARGASRESHLWRMIALLGFGLVHAYFLWHGDILVTYAVLGLLVFTLRNVSQELLIGLGIGAYSIGVCINAGLGLFGPSLAETAPSAVEVQAFLDTFRGSYLTQMPLRIALAKESQTTTFLLYSLPCVGGLMLVGMGLMRRGFFAGSWRRATYTRVAIVGCAIGWTLSIAAIFLEAHFGPSARIRVGVSDTIDLIAQPITAIGYASALLALPLALWHWPLVAVGRTALTCYLLQSLICTTLFYGHGLGWYGSVDRVHQQLIVGCVWVVLLTAAPLWLSVFRQGPVEALWRRMYAE